MSVQRRSPAARITTGAVTALLLVALAAPATTLAGDQRPVRGEFTISLTQATHTCGADLPLAFAGAGIVSHLGRMTGSATHCTEFTLLTEGVAIWDGVAVFVAADGSTITTRYSGWQDPPAGSVATVVTIHELVVGTGRFAGVDGEWTLTGVFDVPSGTSSGTFSGWIGY
jgi:hypothetical protein